MKQNETMTQAMELYVQGMTQKDIARVLGVSEQTVSVWKGSCKGTALDWDNRKYQHNILAVAVESNGFQAYFLRELQSYAEEEGLTLPLTAVKNTLKKSTGSQDCSLCLRQIK